MARANVERVSFDQESDQLTVRVAIHAESAVEHTRLAEFTGGKGKACPVFKEFAFSDGLRITVALPGFYGHGSSPKPQDAPTALPAADAKKGPRGSRVVRVSGNASDAAVEAAKDAAKPKNAVPSAPQAQGTDDEKASSAT